MIVRCGTVEFDTALINREPALMIPACERQDSYKLVPSYI